MARPEPSLRGWIADGRNRERTHPLQVLEERAVEVVVVKSVSRRTRTIPETDGASKLALEKEQPTLSETAYRQIRSDIISGAFQPGQPLRLEALKLRYGLSFSPIREALNRLQTERLVVGVASRGFFVEILSIEEMWDATNTRILIESEALRRSIQTGGDDWEAEIVAAFHSLDLQSQRQRSHPGSPTDAEFTLLETRHQDFHKSLIKSCHSKRLLNIADQLYVETQRYRLPVLVGGNGAAPARDLSDEHRRIMDATLARQSDKAVELLTQHYVETARFIERNSERQKLGP